MDKAHKAADERLKQLERELSAAYSAAWADIKRDLAELGEVDLSGLTPQERFDALSRGERLERLSLKAARRLSAQNKAAAAAIETATKEIYVDNYNFCVDKYGGRERKRGDDVKNIFDAISLAALIDVAEQNRRILSALSTGVYASASTNRIVFAVRAVINTDLETAVLVANNTTTRAENQARQDFIDNLAAAAALRAKAFTKTWRSVGDSKTRPAHRAADGQTVPYDRPFIVDGEQLMFPGDSSLGAKIGNTINCRCVMILTEL